MCVRGCDSSQGFGCVLVTASEKPTDLVSRKRRKTSFSNNAEGKTTLQTDVFEKQGVV